MNAPTTTTPTPSDALSPRLAPHQGNALRGIWYLTSRRFLSPSQWLLPAGLLALLALFACSTIREGNAAAYFRWMSGFYLTFLIPIMAFLSGAGAMRDDLKAGSVDYVFTRPVRRPAFLIFKYLSHLACTQIVYLVAFGVMVAAGAYRHVPGISAALPLLLLGQFLMVAAFVAFGFLCAVLTSRYIVVGLLYGAIVEVGIGKIPTQLGALSMTHQVKSMLEPLTAGGRIALTAPQSPLIAATIVLVFCAVVLALAATCFAVQELEGAGRRES